MWADQWMKITGLVLATSTVLAGTYEGVTITNDKIQQLDQLEEAVHEGRTYTQLVGERLENKITEDQYKAIESRQWALDDRYNGIRNAPPVAREEYRLLEQEKEGLKRRLNEINDRVRSLGSSRGAVTKKRK